MSKPTTSASKPAGIICPETGDASSKRVPSRPTAAARSSMPSTSTDAADLGCRGSRPSRSRLETSDPRRPRAGPAQRRGRAGLGPGQAHRPRPLRPWTPGRIRSTYAWRKSDQRKRTTSRTPRRRRSEPARRSPGSGDVQRPDRHEGRTDSVTAIGLITHPWEAGRSQRQEWEPTTPASQKGRGRKGRVQSVATPRTCRSRPSCRCGSRSRTTGHAARPSRGSTVPGRSGRWSPPGCGHLRRPARR